jgi:uncharacterized protein (DUF4415 family)
MRKKKLVGARRWTDPDEAPRLDRDWFKRAEIREGGRLIRKGRPRGRRKSPAPKQAVSLRLDADVVAHFRATGPGCQSRINAALRRAVRR